MFYNQKPLCVGLMVFGPNQRIYTSGFFPIGPPTMTLIYAPKDFLLYNLTQKRIWSMLLMRDDGFGGSVGIFITPWFPCFDANSMVVSKMSVWVRLYNLPLPFWHHQVLEGIGNILGRYIKTNLERPNKGIFTFSRICVEVDLSKGLLDHINLIHTNFHWKQPLDFENMTLRWHICFQTRC